MVAMLVLRQNRWLANAAGTMIESSRSPFTMNSVPVIAFSGLVNPVPSGPWGLMARVSRHVPVHSGNGSIFALACVSL